MLYEFQFFRFAHNAPENAENAPTIRSIKREFRYQEAAKLYGLTNAKQQKTEEKTDGFRLYDAEGNPQATVIFRSGRPDAKRS
jgi:hypothetical protein